MIHDTRTRGAPITIQRITTGHGAHRQVQLPNVFFMHNQYALASHISHMEIKGRAEICAHATFRDALSQRDWVSHPIARTPPRTAMVRTPRSTVTEATLCRRAEKHAM